MIRIQNPQNITRMMHAFLGHRLKAYAYTSNAQLGTIQYVDGPVWVMELNEGRTLHYAIFEVQSRNLYIYAGGLRYTPTIDLHQQLNLGDRQAEVFSDEKGNVCLYVEEEE